MVPGGLWSVTSPLVGSGWLVIFPVGSRMVTVISWWALDGCCYLLVVLVVHIL